MNECLHYSGKLITAHTEHCPAWYGHLFILQLVQIPIRTGAIYFQDRRGIDSPRNRHFSMGAKAQFDMVFGSSVEIIDLVNIINVIDQNDVIRKKIFAFCW